MDHHQERKGFGWLAVKAVLPGNFLKNK